MEDGGVQKEEAPVDDVMEDADDLVGSSLIEMPFLGENGWDRRGWGKKEMGEGSRMTEGSRGDKEGDRRG